MVLYFDEEGQYIGAGTIHDPVVFKWIPDEESRKHPDQVVDSQKFYGMAQDGASLSLDLSSVKGHRQHRSFGEE